MKSLIAFLACVAGLASAGGTEMTRFYRTTFAQDFREVVNAGWGDEMGPGSMIIDLDAAVGRQTFRGLGGSFAEASCFTLMRLPEEKRARALSPSIPRRGRSSPRTSIRRFATSRRSWIRAQRCWRHRL